MATIRANYGIQETIANIVSFVYTRCFWRKARLIRLPSRIRGKKAIAYGPGFTTGYSCRIEVGGELKQPKLIIGNDCIMGDYGHVVANHSVTIGDNVLIASRVFISDTSHGCYAGENEHSLPEQPPNLRTLYFSRVIIGNNVWIGENVSILQGVEIGDGCIVGANSVVTQSIAPNTIVAGCPAKIVKVYNPSTMQWERPEGRYEF